MLVTAHKRQHIITANEKPADAETQSQLHIVRQCAVGYGHTDAEYFHVEPGGYSYLAVIRITIQLPVNEIAQISQVGKYMLVYLVVSA